MDSQTLLTIDLSNPYTFLGVYYLWRLQRDKVEAGPCRGQLHSYWLCCPAHRALLADRAILDAWANYFDTTYDMHRQYGTYLSECWLDALSTRLTTKGNEI